MPARLPFPESPQILVVDDDPDHRELLTELLKMEGYSVATAAGGREALDYLGHCRSDPELILLDLGMPEMDGRQFRKQERTRGADTSVIVLSAEPRGLTADLDCVAYLRKPIDVEQLLHTVRQVVSADASCTKKRTS